MEALGSPSISWALMGGSAMLSEYRKLVYADDRYNDNVLLFTPVSKFLRLSHEEHKIYVLSKNLYQSVIYAQNKSCLACK